MNYFINYNAQTDHVSINTFRESGGFFRDDIKDLVYDVEIGHSSSCDLEGAKDALQDGEIWKGSIVKQETLEVIHAAISEFELESQLLYFGFY